MTNMVLDDWPTPYIADAEKSPHRRPGLPRLVIRHIAKAVTARFLDSSKTFGNSYSDLVDALDSQTVDHAADFLDLLFPLIVRGGGDFSVANEHDFANIHRSAWLLLYEPIVQLLNYNIHGDWGDPPGGKTSHGEDIPPVKSVEPKPPPPPPPAPGPSDLFRFHIVPNLTGFFAVSTQDYPAPDTGIGTASSAAPRAAVVNTEPINDVDVKTYAIEMARRMVADGAEDALPPGTVAVGDAYLNIVKKYHRDGGNHTQEYSDLIASVVSPDVPLILNDDDVANIHRGMWLYLVSRFSRLVGLNPFGDFAPVHGPTRSVPLPDTLGGARSFDVPNKDGAFHVNLKDIDP